MKIHPRTGMLAPMKVTSDDRGRLAVEGLIPPNACFEAQSEEDGSIRLVQVRGAEVPVVRAREVDGRFTGAAIKLDRRLVAAAVRAERDGL